MLSKTALFKTLPAALLASLLITSLSASATPYDPNGGDRWGWAAQLERISIDQKAAKEEYIGDSALSLGLAAERHSGGTMDTTLTLGLNFIAYDDKADFTVLVEDSSGDRSTRSSDASAMALFAEFGPKLRVGPSKMGYFTVRGGLNVMMMSERSISYCSDCPEQDINIDGGFYGILGAGRSIGSFDLVFEFQQYFTGDLDNSLKIKLSQSF